ncbi:hypothetical protein E2H86_18750 [Pseudomonas putida]|uniref:hypothetical protein n=1 Tax=Pseudomonas putida group TaxID=136845 RepID=UPI00105A95DE|nr:MULTISPECIES: hypothetical protein [Pseudomonas putida group]MBF8747006.1 hypothetical protein [Pseudomonas monteilii]TDJ74640.1 hypothetical protein E2H86_18750 [Pseudomonas putida]
MEHFHEAARGLQKTLLDLRRSRDRLLADGELEKAAALGLQIRQMEQMLSNLPPALRPATLQ